jgi:plasmid stability protein
MADLPTLNIQDDLRRLIEARALVNGRSFSEEVGLLLRHALDRSDGPIGMGTYMFSLVDPADRGDDLIFEIKGAVSDPPDFE